MTLQALRGKGRRRHILRDLRQWCTRNRDRNVTTAAFIALAEA